MGACQFFTRHETVRGRGESLSLSLAREGQSIYLMARGDIKMGIKMSCNLYSRSKVTTSHRLPFSPLYVSIRFFSPLLSCFLLDAYIFSVDVVRIYTLSRTILIMIKFWQKANAVKNCLISFAFCSKMRKICYFNNNYSSMKSIL